MPSPLVLTILTNYKRPANLPRVVDALQRQSVRTAIVIVDNSPDGLSEHMLRQPWATAVADIVRVRTNLGPPCRFLPALAFHDYDYVYFHDEDMLPGTRAIEHLLRTSELLNGEFATIGQFGRRFRGGPGDPRGRDWVYVLRHVGRLPDQPMPVDMTCNAHFVRAENVRHALALKWDLIRNFGRENIQNHIHVHDDLLLCLGIQRATGWSSWLTPSQSSDAGESDGGESSLRKEKLKDNDAICARPTHRQERTELARMAGKVGWKSLWREREKEREQERELLLTTASETH